MVLRITVKYYLKVDICEETVYFRGFSLIRDNMVGVMGVALIVGHTYCTHHKQLLTILD